MSDAYDETLVDQYDRQSFVWRLYVPVVRRLLEQHPGPTMLDLGCGTGSLLLAVGDAYSAGLGVDISPEMIRVAERKTGLAPHINVGFQVADVRTFTPPESYDLITCTDGVLPYLHDTSELSAFLGSVSRTINPGGRALIEVWTHAANPEPTEGSATIADGSTLVPEELHRGDFIRESTAVPELGFSRHRYYFPDKPYSYTVMNHGAREVVHRHRYFDPSADVAPLLEAHGLSLIAEYGLRTEGDAPVLTAFASGSAIWAGLVTG